MISQVFLDFGNQVRIMSTLLVQLVVLRIDPEQQIAGLDGLAEFDAHFDEITGNLGHDGCDERAHARMLAVRRDAICEQMPHPDKDGDYQ